MAGSALRERPGLWGVALLCLLELSAAQTSYSVSEEVEKGAVVGNLAKDLHLNVQELESRALRIVAGHSKRFFDVNVKTGALFVTERIDREELCGSAAKCSVNIEAILSNPMQLHRIEVHVLDVNDNAPTFPETLYTVNISELAYPGERFPLPVAHDADLGSNSVKSYKLSPNEHFSLDVQSGGEQSVSAELVLQKALDREKQPVIQLTLTAVDGGKPPKSGTLQIKVNVEDVNDNIPAFSKSLYKVRVSENSPVGSTVIKLEATDLDEGVNGELVYSITAGGSSKISDQFTIDSVSGEMTIKGNLDHEENAAYEIRAQARDKGTPSRVTHCKVLVEVLDVNDNAPEITVSSVMSPVREDSAVGTVVALVTVSDRDSGNNGEAKASVSGSVPFKLKPSYKNYYSLVVDGPLDRESTSQYSVTIAATDEGSPPLSSSTVITVEVSDVNDNAPLFPEPVINVYVKENGPVGAVISTVSALDPDVGENARITYSLLENSRSAAPVSSLVNIDSESGHIHTLQSFNFEEMKTFEFRVQATDSGLPPLSSNVSVQVFVLDENDNSPGILAPYSEHGSVNTENIPYSAEAGYFVAKIRAVDADSGYNALLSYHISEPKGNKLFRIGSSSGEVRTKRRMSDNDLKSHPLLIVVSDHGEPSLSATVSIDVVVVESTADIQTQFKHVPMKEESFSELNVYLLIAIVSVSVIFLLSLVSSIAVRCCRTDGPFSRYSPPVITTHPDGSWSYSKSTQQYDVCFSSDTLKSDVVVFPAPFPPADAELISINGGDTFTRTQTLPSSDKDLYTTLRHVSAVILREEAADRCVDAVLSELLFAEMAGSALRERPGLWGVALLCLLELSAAQTSYSVSEEVEKGAVVGNLAKDLHLNVQELESRALRIVAGHSKRFFDVNVKTGALFVTERIDREELCGKALKCSVNLEAILSNPMQLHRIEVHVLDVNDNAPYFHRKSHNINITESAYAGERFPLPVANDADVGVNSVKSYKLSPNEHFSLDVQSGGEQSVSAELVLQKALDREKQPVIQLTLTAVDGGKPPKSGTMLIVINVVDVNDNTPVFSKQLYKVRVSENSPVGTTLITLTATDLDDGVNGEIVYTLIEQGASSSSGLFKIDPHSGEITVQGQLDYEENAAFEIRAQASDRGHSPRSTHCKVLVEVTDVNDNAPIISVTSLMSSVKEDSALGMVVALVTVTDKDSGKNGVSKVEISGSAQFKLTSSYKNYYSLVVDGPLDRESTSQYDITITATDEGSPPLSSSTVITVEVSDVNDNAPLFPEPVINVYVKENGPVGAVISTVSALDPDVGENARITYSLLESSRSAAPVSSLVNIDSESGHIHTLQSFNFEEMKTFEFRVQATDSGLPPLSSNVSVQVFVLDENDNSPGILAPYSEHGSVNTENIPYSAEAGYFVAKIRAVDADSGYNALLSYHISEPKGNKLFRIGSSSGEVRTKRRMSDNDLKSHPLLIVVSDHGEPSLSATVSIDVVVVESTADIQTQFKHVPMKEESFSELNVYLLIAIVSVSVIFLLSLVSSIAVRCCRTDGPFSRYSPPVITTHPDGSWSYSKSTQEYDVCFSSDTLKSDVVVFPAPFPPADAELISINGGDTFTRTQTLPSSDKSYVLVCKIITQNGSGGSANFEAE
ncbi:uncharacterized protein [Hoplias malabaricus]|uniref:uncharacterized protein n=1 Tax=Hoplias malabaricus TaxID=27720 RepID=UPI00346188EB